jgi:hypothetical protein
MRRGGNWHEQIRIAGEVGVLTGYVELQSALLSLVEANSKSGGPDILMLRLIAAVLDYGINAERKRQRFAVIQANLHHALRDFVQYQFKTKFDAVLPDPVDQILCNDVKTYCSRFWDDLMKFSQTD